MIALASIFLAVFLFSGAPAAGAEAEAEVKPEAAGPNPAVRKLAEEFSDPLTTLPQLFIQDAYTPANYGTTAQTNRVILRAIIPRIPKYSLLPFVQLIRPTFSLVTVPTGTVKGGATRTVFGDIQLFDIAVIPWPDRKHGLIMGVGPVFVFPTTTDKRAGQGAWQVGPALGAIYKGIPGILVGGLVQNPISFAYTARDRQAVSALLVQPVLLTYLGWGFYAKSADATWTIGWHHGRATTLPLSFGLGYVMLRENWPPINVFVTGEWMAYHQYAPVAPQTTVRFGMTMAFPQWRPW